MSETIAVLEKLANQDESEPGPGNNNPMLGKVAQKWAAEMLGTMSTPESIRALAAIEDWDVRHEGFMAIGTIKARSILIELMQDTDRLVYSVVSAAGNTGYSKDMRDALIEVISDKSLMDLYIQDRFIFDPIKEAYLKYASRSDD